MGIRNKLLLTIAGALLISLVSSTYFQIRLYNEAFETELEKRITLLQQNLNQRALLQAQNLSALIAESLASFNLFSLSQLIHDQVEHYPELHQAVLVSKEDIVFVHSNDPTKHQKQYTPKAHSDGNRLRLETPEHVTVSEIKQSSATKDSQTRLLEYQVPIEIGNVNWGTIYLQYSLEGLDLAIAKSTKENSLLQKEQTNKAVHIATIILLITFVLIAQLSERLIAPIARLSAYAKEIARHNFTKVYDIETKGKDEISELSYNFKEMAKSLEENHLEQTHYNLRLEEKVNERTKELNTKNEELVKAFKKVEESQQQLIYSEKMAALGQLVSGIAHEINTPLGAINASATNTANSLNNHLDLLKPILAKSEDPNAVSLHKVLSLIDSTPALDYEALNTRDERRIKKDLRLQLSQFQPTEASMLAEMLLEMGLHNSIEELKPEIEDPENNEVIALAHSLVNIQNNTQTIHTAIARVSKIVFALKTFSHKDSTGEMVESNINEGINTVLVLYQNQLKQGCDVHKDLAELPSTLCYPDELNQVWTNLIHNALQAMENHGTISITTRTQQDHIFVEIRDNGPGIPIEIQDKVFSSFFTTKPAGEGSGLGLGICKKIIDKHEGKIYLASEPGCTTFTVSIPVRTTH